VGDNLVVVEGNLAPHEGTARLDFRRMKESRAVFGIIEVPGTSRSLAYDLEGRSNSVKLGVTSLTGGSGWLLTRGRAHSQFAIQATEGKFKGWYLDWTEDEEAMGYLRVRRLILSEKPKQVKNFLVYPIAK